MILTILEIIITVLLFSTGLFFLISLLYRIKVKLRQCPDLLRDQDQFTVQTQDQITIDGISLTSDVQSGPAIILAHGFADNKTNCELVRLAEYLRRDFNVFLFDFRGYGESKGKSTMGYKEILDLEAVISYVMESGYKDIHLIGNSIGGLVSIRAAANHDTILSVTTISTSANFFVRDPYRRKIFEFIFQNPLGRFLLKTATSISISKEISSINAADLLSMAPVSQLKEIPPIPILFVHGTRDKIVPVSNVFELFESALEPKQIKVFEGGGHSVTDLGKEFGDTFRSFLLDWLKSNSKANL